MHSANVTNIDLNHF